ncbi:conserved Plasmodium protein, unknown function [Plasmodium berghei]|uniref:Uncharacterized protein n=2 Tax=Plasmodium berghei TaxID=5821 RepID=A0A509AQA6_PLABA|nr:conserved protein, unknown function [Plasmodium berghei ANKA]CXI45398.1 conserved Plasmodium protein, unknown function [Plasmodium berghei]SCN25579.1 conserved Plasmodium protein, unknown function [Plasmodium berghei]SCO60529.1 conserved Plasmodium protein, unknown function [Plasmodium berghei]VUC55897.1 conserved protein, unknown function [Plasmodium berghei ANKA]|eukprot:XP_034421707.1 conserved protein, unknown function [Plasmodium berghei ANKA]
MSDKSRRSFILGIIIILILCSSATFEPYRYMWIFLSICVSVLLIIDIIFLGPDKFIYDPFYSNWEKTHIKDL